jgi:hypothetical protein
MNSNRTGYHWIAALVVLAGLSFLMAPGSWAQAQENIANLNTQNTNNEQQVSPPAQQLPPDNQQTVAPDMGMSPAPDDTQDPPTRVARVSFLDGSVSLQPGGVGDWGTATKNRPVTIGDKVWVDQSSRAELEAGQASVHLGAMTALSFLNLNQNIIQMRMAEGHINFRVRELRQGETYEVDTPNLAFTVTEAGAFRIDVNENGDYTSVTVIRGKGEVSVAGQSYPVNAGERGDVSGTDQNVKFIPGSASEPDALDKWAQDRDLRLDNSASSQYVSRDTVGYGDLDDYGSWKQDPEAGNVWVPNNMPPDWAPYSDGNWSYVAPWGWTWVGSEPWGFAPYHYGRWMYTGGAWGWCPGPIWAPPVYGPAFVGFLGFGFGFGFGFGHAWFPLGWGEPYHPWYHCGPGYWNHINVYNTHINNYNARNYNNFNYRYAHDPHAVTAASHHSFVNGQGINRGATHLTAENLRNARVAGGPNASPTRASYMSASGMHGRVATPSQGVENRSVVARSTPAAAASHLAARSVNSSGFSANRGNASTGNFGRGPSNTMMNARQSQLSANRPPSSFSQGSQGSRNIGSMNNSSRPPAAFNNNASRANSSGANRSWSAQGSATDSGRAPQGFGNNRATTQTARMNSSNRPPWAGSSVNSAGYNGSAAGRNNTYNRPSSSYGGGNRSYTPPSYSNRSNGSYSAPNRNYSPRSYSAPSNRTYSSAPHSYSAPRSYSAPPSHSYSAPHSSGGSSHGSGGGGGSHGGGGGSHGGGHR